MTLALIPPSSGRNRVESAAALLRQAMAELYAAQREEAAEYARRADSLMRDEAARVALQKVQAAREGHMMRIDRRWLEQFGSALEDVAKEIGKRGERSHAGEIGRLLGMLRDKLDGEMKGAR
jgi:hypothetical protein